MTKIKMLNDRIIFDGHADTRQECETITLMCDNLAKSKDFKTVRYESGYAEFEKVGKTDELKFVPELMPTTINFDSHVIKVEATNEYSDTYTWTTSGQTVNTKGNGGVTYYATVTLEDGYEIDTVTSDDMASDSASGYNLLTFSGNEISFRTVSSGMGSGFTITTKAAATKQTIDVSELSGWANLATGNHQITVKTKASGYADSAASNAVTVNKAASGYTVTFSDQESGGASGDAYYSLDDGATWTQFCAIYSDDDNDLSPSSLSNITSIKFKIVVNDLGVPPFGVKLVCSAIGMSLGGKNTGTFTSDNYTLTEDITVIITT